MNIRHAAVLALVGWFLIHAPEVSDSPLRFDIDAHLAKWTVLASFDSEEKCNTALDERFLKRIGFDPQTPTRKLSSQEEGIRRVLLKYARQETEAERCIKADDPRLKSK